MKNPIKALLVLASVTFILTGTVQAQEPSHSGQWTKAEVGTSGTWRIEGNTVFLENLSTKRAPDLKVILSPHQVGDLKSRNAMTGAVIVSPLSSSKGNQSYQLPEGIDLSNYASIGIHCQRYTKLFAKSAL